MNEWITEWMHELNVSGFIFEKGVGWVIHRILCVKILIILHIEVVIFAGTVSGDAYYALHTINPFRMKTI